MKAINYLSLFLFALSLISCGQVTKKELNDENTSLNSQVDSLKAVVSTRDSILNEVLITVSDISASLDEIKRQEGIVLSNTELSRLSRDKINDDLIMMSSILESKRKQIISLEKLKNRLGASEAKVMGLEKLISQLEKQINERDYVIKKLSENINDLDNTINELNKEVGDLQISKNRLAKTVETQQQQSQTKYYIVGKEKELIANGVLQRVGGLSRDVKVNPNIDKNRLIKIDMYDLKEIELTGKKAIVVGNFPTSSYTIESYSKNRVDKMVIDDIDKFWEGNTILVIALR